MTLKALQDCLIVRPDLEKSAMIELLRKERTGTGVVVKAGPHAKDCKEGGRVLFGDSIGQALEWEGEDLLVMRDAHVLGVFEDA